MRFIIILRGYRPTTAGRKIAEFVFMEKYDAYVWQGRDFSAKELNEKIDTVMDRYRDTYAKPPTVRVLVPKNDMTKARQAKAVKETTSDSSS